MPTLQTRPLEELFSRLDRFDTQIPRAFLARELERLEVDVPRLARFHVDHYCKTLLHQGPAYEAWVIGWLPGQCSAILNHRGSMCCYMVCKGIATELLFKRSPGGYLYPYETERHSAPKVLDDLGDDIHQVCNLETSDLVTLNIYSPALRNGETYGLEETPFGEYDALLERMNLITVR